MQLVAFALAMIVLGVGIALLILGLVERWYMRRQARLKFINEEAIKRHAAEAARKV